MKRLSSALILCASFLVCLAGLRVTSASAQASRPMPSASVRRVTSLAGTVIAGDFNGDGVIDLAAASASSPVSPPVMVALGSGDGTFKAAMTSGVAGGLRAAGDFNKDGKLDLIVAGGATSALTLWPGKGNGTFGPPQPIGSESTFDVGDAVVGDVNGDGNLDVAVVLGDGADVNWVYVYPGHGDGTFGAAAAQLLTGTDAGSQQPVLADLNGDGRLDIVVANHYAKTVSIFLNQGAFAFTASDRAIGRNANDVAFADLNGDTKLDMVVANSLSDDSDTTFEDGAVDVFLGNGDGTFGVGQAYGTAYGAWRVVIADFNRDGIVDIASASRSAAGVHDCGPFYKTWDAVDIWSGVGNGTFVVGSEFSIGNQRNIDDPRYRHTVSSLAVADVNGDHHADLVVSNGVVFIGTAPDPNWTPSVTASATAPGADHAVTLKAAADDVDQDVLAYLWTDSASTFRSGIPNPCFTPSTLGVHTFTVTVSDQHGHATSSSVTVDFGPSGGGSTGPKMTLMAPAAGATIAEGTPYTVRFHIDDPNMQLYEWSVDYSLDNGATWNYIWECHNTGASSDPRLPTSRDDSCTWKNPGPAATQAMLVVYAQDDADASIGTASSVRFTIAPQPGGVPYPWQQTDIGAVATAGSTSVSNGVFTVKASGADIWGTADEFRYTYLTSADSLIAVTARVDSVQNVNAWTKAGVMLRAGLGAAAPQASLFVSPGKGIAFQRRLTAGGSSVSTAGPPLTAPVWLKLVTQVTYPTETVRAYFKKNVADAWTLVGEDTFPRIIDQPLAGLALSSHADGTLATAAFSSVSVTPVISWTAQSIGVSGGAATWNDVQVTLKGIGADIWGTADQFEYAYQDCFGDCTITARVRSLVNTNQWAKAGVMIRESTLPNARHVDLVVSPSKGVAMQYRSVAGGASQQAAVRTGVAPGWVRLTRAGNVFTGFWSTDGVTFVQVGTVTLPMNASTFIGLAATSHNPAVATTAVFEEAAIVSR
jgi:hypothetical protein